MLTLPNEELNPCLASDVPLVTPPPFSVFDYMDLYLTSLDVVSSRHVLNNGYEVQVQDPLDKCNYTSLEVWAKRWNFGAVAPPLRFDVFVKGWNVVFEVWKGGDYKCWLLKLLDWLHDQVKVLANKPHLDNFILSSLFDSLGPSIVTNTLPAVVMSKMSM